MAKAFNNIGIGYAIDGEKALSNEFFQKAIKINKRNNNYKLLLANYKNLGHLFLRNANYSESLRYLTKALNYCELADNWDLYEGIIDHIATNYYKLGDYTTSLKYLFHLIQSIKINERKDHGFIAGLYESIASCYDKLNNYDKAIEYYNKALSLMDKYGLEIDKDVVYNNLSNVYLNLKDLDNAQYFQERHYVLCIKNFDTLGIAISTLNFAKIFVQKRELKKAWQYLDTSLKLSQYLKDTVGIAESYIGFAEYYQFINRYKESIVYYHKALDIFRNGIFPLSMTDIYSNLADLYFKIKDFKSAYHYSRLLDESKERIKEQSHKALVLAMNVKRESEKAAYNYKKEIERQRSDNNILLFIIPLILAIILALIVGYWKYNKKRLKVL